MSGELLIEKAKLAEMAERYEDMAKVQLHMHSNKKKIPATVW